MQYRLFAFIVNQRRINGLHLPQSTTTFSRLAEALGEAGDGLLQSTLEVLAQSTLLVNGSQKIGLVALQVCKEVGFPLKNLVDWNAIEVTVDTSVDEWNHLVDSHWRVLLLLEKLGQLYMKN